MSRISWVRSTAFLFFILLFVSVAARAQTTAFTYQGRFVDSTVPQPTTGSYEMQYKMFDTEQVGTGNQLDVTKPIIIVSVTNGIFTLKLDFEPLYFTFTNCFIEVGVRPAGSLADFTVLGPRQQITAAPLASRSLSSAKADTAFTADFLGGTSASGFVLITDPRLTDSRNPNPSSANYIQNQSAFAQPASINIGGTAYIGSNTTISGNASIAGNALIVGSADVATLNAATVNVSGNTTATGNVSGNVVNSGTHFNINGTQVLAADTNNNTFAGRFSASGGSSNTMVGSSTGNAALTVMGTTAVGSSSHPQGDLVTVLGYQATSAIGVTNSTAIGANAFVSTSNTIKMGTPSESTEFPGAVRLITLGQPGATSLCRNGSLQISTCTAGNLAEKNSESITLLSEQNTQMREQLKRQQEDIAALRAVVCAIQPSPKVCRQVID